MEKKIEFIIPTYSRINHLITILGSLKSQSNPNWVAHIVADCPPEEIQQEMKIIVEFFNDERIKLTILPERYNDWGHTPRQYGLTNATEEWVVMTGEDNYYVPEFVDVMLRDGENHHFVYCDMVHNWINNEYIPLLSKLELGKIDIGSFMCKTNMAKKIKLRTDQEWADWFFVEEFKKKYKIAKYKKVNRILYVHN
jgi:glycosyltransferase involved in cell wall biosynthesis